MIIDNNDNRLAMIRSDVHDNHYAKIPVFLMTSFG